MSSSVLINGDLVISGFPDEIENPVGSYVVYHLVKDQAWYWFLSDCRFTALEVTIATTGHIERIDTFERQKGDNYAS